MSETYSTNARWFDGHDNRARMALVRIHGEHLELVPHASDDSSWPPLMDHHNAGQGTAGAGGALRGTASRYPAVPTGGSARQYARALLRVGERWRGTPVPVLLPDGGTVMLSPDSAVAKALAPRSVVTQLIARWPSVLLSLTLGVTLVFALSVWAHRQGGVRLDAPVAAAMGNTLVDGHTA